jgi:Ni/Co efflux regulator RcnB
MKKPLTLALALTLLAGTGSAFAQPGHDDHNNAPTTQQRPDDHNNAMAMHGPSMSMKGPAMHGPAHPEWRQGGHIAHDDWGRGVQVDYRAHHLRKPPRGYEWRQVDGNFVLAAAATGLIASIILASH